MTYSLAKFFIYVHETFGLCFWNFLALVLAVIVAVAVVIHRYRHKKREKEFEKEMKLTQQAIPAVEA